MTATAGALPAAASRVRRIRIELTGTLQGVGLRPAAARLASAFRVTGWIANSAAGVTLEVEGPADAAAEFLQSLPAALPPHATIENLRHTDAEPVGYAAFAIRDSLAGDAGKTAVVVPDLVACGACIAEISDPSDRRYRYPFTSCTNCGPRFSILEALPFDRANTTMRRFTMCPRCQAEYGDPHDRRFHAQTNACPDCGPRVWMEDAAARTLGEDHDAIELAALALRAGKIVALKGLGGFQLLADAGNDAAVAELRRRKHRLGKPFAVMAPDLAWVEQRCRVSAHERDALTAAAAPIVLLERRPGAPGGIADAVAPRNPLLGVMLPTTPLHHLLLRESGGALVATSGNVSGAPLVADDASAREQLRDVADVWLLHDRPIKWTLDDSVARVIADRPLVLRLGRGYAPHSVKLAAPSPPALALGGQLKSGIAVIAGDRIVLGPYIGDLHTPAARERLHAQVEDLCSLHGIEPAAVAADLHPDYYTSRVAAAASAEPVRVQHHLAHVRACMIDNGITGPALGVAFDGTGYGDDGTVWGGEFLRVDDAGADRVAHLREFALPGGDRAVTEPRRAALGLLAELHGPGVATDDRFAPVRAFPASERKVVARMLERGMNSPRTSSVGRLFDAVASMLDLVHVSDFEGEAAMALEFAITEPTAAAYPLPLTDGDGPATLDWGPMLRVLIADLRAGASRGFIAAAFHNGLAAAVVEVAHRVGETRVVLSGGCFQNRYLTEHTIRLLTQAGFEVFRHHHAPPNDGGLALGQAAELSRGPGKGAA